ncbi:hypothetical protein [[Phormidium ambiguum] IAM M-71]|nr:hypothetical protein [Phormidium ambiguum]
MNRWHHRSLRESWDSEVYRPVLKIRLILTLLSSSLFFLMMITTNGKPPTWLWFLFLVFGSSLGIWLQWKEHQARWNAIDREIHRGIAKGTAHQKKRGRTSRKFFT